MPHLTDLVKNHRGPFHTLEFFPPRTEAGFVNLLDRIQRLASGPLPPPLAISVTWGAGGSTADRTMELAEEASKLGLDVILHLTCTNMPKEKVDSALKRARDLGIQNVLALRGDPPRSEEYSTTLDPEPDFFQHADDLVRYIRKEYNDWFCIGVAGYPTPHVDSESPEMDLHWLKQKCDAGADFIITQLFYDVQGFEQWVRSCRDFGITQTIIPGMMPIQSFSSFRRLVNLTKCPVPDNILRDLEPIKSDDAAVKRYGAQLATAMVSRLIANNVVPGVHFCTLNLEKSVRTILENLGWPSVQQRNAHPSPVSRHNRLIEEDADVKLASSPPKNPILSISPSEASQLAQWGLASHALPPAPKKGFGNVGGGSGTPQGMTGEDSWDEYPNGRFTDVRSPAYGEIDGWGSGLKITAAQALKEWGTPHNYSDISGLFTRYLHSDPSTPTTPFCDLPLSPETATILSHLLALNELQYWTVGSQPAVDAVKSEDPVHGWGPRGGYVFQKAFVEFFVRKDEMEKIQARLAERKDADISFYASNKQGDFRTNTGEEAVNAVTWGVFPGQEIVQSTIIEATSFLAWKEEAFDIWTEWSLLYPRLSPARKLLEEIAGECWLVSLIHHDYKDTDGLWNFLLHSK
ncbi:methylenetetrahydrofolate reductase-domain-containing protein [Papiliotrema laurentii]|uniref:Methylenetetrahydrofolate reductase-domain-containing protein n=1 Tax=Papiliotrema laurentii TaxID=5418 RepID=A0AAD9CVS1_PAPLA|nr:methylenetetrahydrofolate reductase-domain-containing protein [Papiliotrema laurentii]